MNGCARGVGAEAEVSRRESQQQETDIGESHAPVESYSRLHYASVTDC